MVKEVEAVMFASSSPPLFAMVRQSLLLGQLGIYHFRCFWMGLSIGTIALSLALVPAPSRAAEVSPTPMTRRTFLQQVPSSRSSSPLGAAIATNYSAYCGITGVPTNSVITDRPLCDTTSIGGDGYDVPVSDSEPAPLQIEIPLAEPMVLQQYNKVQLLPFIPQ